MPRHTAIVLFAACLYLSPVPDPALALPDAAVDSADRFPFVVEVKLQDRLICSGTVLYPRIVVTAAHCLQQKVYWRGGEFYADSYIHPSDLSVGVIHSGRTEAYEVEDTAISPGWLALNQDAGLQSFPYDLALIITKEPIGVETPPGAVEAPAQGPPETEAPVRQGLLVAFGGQHCLSAIECEDAGVRRFLPVAIKDNSDCFKMQGADALFSPRALWCLESTVMPGDSGGALLIEMPDGQLTFAGVISAQGGLPAELGAVAHWRRSVAAGLLPNLPFIAEKARALGYGP